MINKMISRLSRLVRGVAVAGIALGVAMAMAGSAQGVTFSISPSSVSNTYAGQITLQIGGLTTGETVVNNKYLDINTNGVIDASDWLVQSFRLTDGKASTIGGVTNINIPFDSNPANGAITAQLSFLTDGIAQTFVGRYLYRLSSPTGSFVAMTNSFTVTNTAYAQWLTGKVQCGGTNVSYASVLVLPPPSEDGFPIGGTVADGSGNYTINVAPGTYQLLTFKNNYVCNFGAAPVLTVSAGTPVSTNLNLIPATRSISGRLVNSTNTSIGVPGILTIAQSTNLIAIGFSNTNGNFAVPVTASEWQMHLDDQEVPFYGYLFSQNQPTINTTTCSVAGVEVVLSRGTALFYGTIKDEQDHPLAGVQLWSFDSGWQYEVLGTTDSNGNYAVAVLAGDWTVNPDNNGSYESYIMPGFSTNITAGQAVRVDFIGIKGATVSGRVLGGGSPLSGINVQVGTITIQEEGNWNWEQWYNGENTDSNGCYSITVPPGTNYYAQAYTPQGSIWLGQQLYSNAVNITNAMVITALTNAPATNINFNLQRGAIISGCVLSGGVPLSGINVRAGAITYQVDPDGWWVWDWDGPANYEVNTDSNGNYSVTVPPGTGNYVRVQSPIWREQFYNLSDSIEAATPVSALTNAPTTNINFNLQADAKADFDGDGISDYGCYDAAGRYGQPPGSWYFMTSTNGFITKQFGYSGTVPVVGDFDGDGISDYGCYYAPGGNWYFMTSTNGFIIKEFGYSGTIPVVGDFDGDGTCDYGCYDAVGRYGQPAGSWYFMTSSAGFFTRTFGYDGTVPLAGDFDGDGTDDYGCYDAVGRFGQPAGSWYFMTSSAGFLTRTFGYAGTVPLAGDFDGDGRDDYGCYDATGNYGQPSGSWYFMTSSAGFFTRTFGYAGTVPLAGDFDGDGTDDYGCYDAAGNYGQPAGSWYFMTSSSGFFTRTFGYDGTVPVSGL